ncbi:MAG: hypothetical protein Q7J79_04475 [Gemmatimonadales bacterium]|nr:hypothetical protein [Gemmatimonadales bacterium]
MSLRVRPAGVLVALVVTAAVGVLSSVPYESRRGSDAFVRLAWRARGERVETCRRLTPEEVARTPVHMRREEVCEGRILPYRLAVTLDGASAAQESVASGGSRQDRPLYVFREIAVAPGRHRLGVSFSRLGFVREDEGERERGGLPERLDLDTTLTLGPRQVALVTYDEERRRLILKGYGAPAQAPR